jgi:Arc-like DNA binding domain
MARKPSDVIQYKIRIREDLRRRLEQAAEKRDVSINSEIASRLGESFDLPKLDKITSDLENVYTRYAREQGDYLQTQELMNAADYLIKELSASDDVRERTSVKRAIAWVQKSIEAIARVHGRIYEHEPWDQK